MRIHALSAVCTALGLTISTAAMPTGPPPSHDESKAMSLTPKPYPEKPTPNAKPYVALPPPPPLSQKPKPEDNAYTPVPQHPPEGKYKRQEKSYSTSPLPPPPPPRLPPYPEITKSEEKRPRPGAKTKLGEKPKPDVKSRPQKQPYFDEKGKSDKKQKPQDKVILSRE